MFEAITPDEIFWDHLVFRIWDSNIREHLLRETDLSLKRTDEICHTAVSMTAQPKVVEGCMHVCCVALTYPQQGLDDLVEHDIHRPSAEAYPMGKLYGCDLHKECI